jgi:8-oxo-dGTP pyrophosphatase MutT (NUDIX family)
MLKIQYRDKSVFIVKDKSSLASNEMDDSFVVYENAGHQELSVIIENLLNTPYKNIILTNEDTETLTNDFFQHFKLISAAGGLVTNESGNMLFIFRRGKWDLPKGKLDPGESAEAAAAREITEETGVSPLTLLHPITDTYHIYEEKDITILKTTHWFRFSTHFSSEAVPQTEEDITEIKWFSKETVNIPLSNTFDSIREVLTKAGITC